MTIAELNGEGSITVTGVGDHVVPGLQPISDDRGILPLSWSACQMLRGIFGDDLEIGPELKAWGAEEYQRRVEPAVEAREQTDGPEFEVKDREREAYVRELKQIDAEQSWWRDIWRGMPAWIQTENPTWKTFKVLFRGPDEFDRFCKLLGLTRTTRNSASTWYPEEPPIDMTAWRVVDEDTPHEDMPDVARPPLRHEKKERAPRPTSTRSTKAAPKSKPFKVKVVGK